MRHTSGTIREILKNSTRTRSIGKNSSSIIVLHGDHNPKFTHDDIVNSFEKQNLNSIKLISVPEVSRALLFEKVAFVNSSIIGFLQENCMTE